MSAKWNEWDCKVCGRRVCHIFLDLIPIMGWCADCYEENRQKMLSKMSFWERFWYQHTMAVIVCAFIAFVMWLFYVIGA